MIKTITTMLPAAAAIFAIMLACFLIHRWMRAETERQKERESRRQDQRARTIWASLEEEQQERIRCRCLEKIKNWLEDRPGKSFSQEEILVQLASAMNEYPPEERAFLRCFFDAADLFDPDHGFCRHDGYAEDGTTKIWFYLYKPDADRRLK